MICPIGTSLPTRAGKNVIFRCSPSVGESGSRRLAAIRRLSNLDAGRCAEKPTWRLTDCVFYHSTSDFIADGAKNAGHEGALIFEPLLISARRLSGILRDRSTE